MKYLLLALFIQAYSCESIEKRTALAPDQNSTSETDSFQLIQFNEFGVQAAFPNNWEKLKNEHSSFAVRETCDSLQTHCSNCSIRFEPFKLESSLRDYAASSLQVTLSMIRAKDFRVLWSKDTIINGYSALIVDYMVLLETGDYGATFCLYNINNKYIASIYCTGNNTPKGIYAEERKKFMPVIYSVRPIKK